MFHVLFGVVSGFFQQPLLAFSKSIRFLQATTSENIVFCKFTINKVHVDFITKSSTADVCESTDSLRNNYLKMFFELKALSVTLLENL